VILNLRSKKASDNFNPQFRQIDTSAKKSEKSGVVLTLRKAGENQMLKGVNILQFAAKHKKSRNAKVSIAKTDILP
jgi:hypothetical protein